MHKVFVSHTSSQAIEDIKDTLRHCKFLGMDFNSGMKISVSVSKAIEECDVFIAIVDESEKSRASLFEAGIAFAHEKIVIVLHDNTWVPSYSNLDRYITINRRDMDLLEVAVNRLTKRSYNENNSNIDIKNTIKVEMDKTAYKFDNLIEEDFFYLLKNSGSNLKIIDYSSQFNNKEWSPNFSVWIDSLDDSLGNPVMFEIANDLSVEKALKIRDKINKFFRKQSERHTIVVYNHGSDEKVLNSEVEGINLVFVKFGTLESGINSFGLSRTIIKLFTKGY